MNIINVGARIGSLTILDIYTQNGRRVRAQCACGTITRPRYNDVRTGAVQSCGCVRRHPSTARAQGHWGTPLYQMWRNMLDRCERRLDYREKGIRIWEYWQNDFEAFRSWAEQNGFEPGLTIDRRDNENDYRPSNCRFVTHSIQKQNRDVVTVDLATVDAIRIGYYYSDWSMPELARNTGRAHNEVRNALSRHTWTNALQLFREYRPRKSRADAAADAALASIIAHYA